MPRRVSNPLSCPPGGHNVIIGLHDYLQHWHPGSTLVGFLNGPRGVMQNKYKVLTADELVRAAPAAEARVMQREPCSLICCCHTLQAGRLPQPGRLPPDLQRP